ncbi:MAG: N(4)-(beta-N-acetylglucosaminyl)-L-asparaginase [Salibacteraceae bacterium]
MTSRRKFIRQLSIGALGSALSAPAIADELLGISGNAKGESPIVLSTWRHGLEANKAAWKILLSGGSALDAVERGVRITESDPSNMSVGLGGLPDRDGNVTLDACIMDGDGRCGSVAFLQEFENPISVARKVMDETEHVMLVGKGAQDFALEQGFRKTNLLTDASKKRWLEWKEKEAYKPIINIENHDTIGMIAMDARGELSGACTTSGLAFKRHGRVGDSPIIGAGLFVDNEVGAACATGLGEKVMSTVGSFLVVELMRQGHSPNKACKMAVDRIKAKNRSLKGVQVGFIALNKNGDYGGHSIYAGFDYALTTNTQTDLINSTYEMEWD